MDDGSHTVRAAPHRSPDIGHAYATAHAALILAALALLAGACSARPPAVPTSAAAPDTVALQLESLRYLYYRDTPLPSMPDAAEIAEAGRRIAVAQPLEKELLTALYPAAPTLWALATRDSDGDGLKDYRVSDYFGRFLEGDTDVDGDGVANVLDAHPYDVSAPLDGAREVPAHLRWTADEKPGDVLDIQEALYRDHGILLIERNADFPSGLARVTFDVITRVYSSVFAERQSLPTLRVVATEESSLLYADAEEGAGDFAQVLPATQTLVIYRQGIDAPPVIQLGFLVHELGHTLQFAMDDDPAERTAIASGRVAYAPRFHALASRFGWERIPAADEPSDYFELFRPQYLAPEPWEYRYRGKPPDAWQEWLDAIYRERGEYRYLEDERVVTAQVLGDYSLTNPWEWYSDHLIAYLYLAMFDSLREDCTAGAAEAAETSFQRSVVSAYWPYFRFVNARDAPFRSWLGGAFPLERAAVAELVATYLSAYASSTEDSCRRPG